MTFAIAQIAALPAGFERLRASAEAEGFAFLTRLATRWHGGRYEDDTLATVSVVLEGNELIAIGAQTFDEYDPAPQNRRIRHFYVHPSRRRSGCGRALAGAL